MVNGLSAAVERLLQDLIVASSRRQWPALRLVPDRWLRVAVAPTARRLQRTLACFAIVVLSAVVLAVLIVRL
jgi:hypothetical protein